MLSYINMDFRERKLPKEAALNLRNRPVSSVDPYALMLGPVYVFMKLNEKFVSIKGPLDFFTPEELEQFRSFESFFLPEFVDSAIPFSKTGRRVRSLLDWQPKKAGEALLPPAPYEISDAVIRMIGPLWGFGEVIEPFFASVFTNELCRPLPPKLLVASREYSVPVYEDALLRSGWAVFLALHLGYCDLPFLMRLRLRVFRSSMRQQIPDPTRRMSEVDELVEIVSTSLCDDPRRPVTGELFSSHPSRVAQKMSGKLQRIKSMIPEGQEAASIFGEGGFADV